MRENKTAMSYKELNYIPYIMIVPANTTKKISYEQFNEILKVEFKIKHTNEMIDVVNCTIDNSLPIWGSKKN